MKKYVFGIDLGGTTVKLGLFTISGELLDKWEIVTRTDNGGEAILPDIAAALEGKMQEKGIAAEDLSFKSLLVMVIQMAVLHCCPYPSVHRQ